jgi:hypothetical protein
VITVYGGSDDLLEVEGDIREEFDHADQAGRWVACSDGTLLRVTEDEGIWRVSVDAGTAQIVPARGEDEGDDEDGCPGYSEKAIVTGDVRWVVVGKDLAR